METLEFIDPIVLAIESAIKGGFFYNVKKIFFSILCIILGFMLAIVLWPAAYKALELSNKTEKNVGPIGSVIHPFAHIYKYLGLYIASLFAQKSESEGIRTLGNLGAAIAGIKFFIAFVFIAFIFFLLSAPITIPYNLYNKYIHGGLDGETMQLVQDIHSSMDPIPKLKIESATVSPIFIKLENRATDGTFIRAISSFSIVLNLKHKSSYLDGIIKYAEVSCLIKAPGLTKKNISYKKGFVLLQEQALVNQSTKNFIVEVPQKESVGIENFQYEQPSLTCNVIKTSSEKSIFSNSSKVELYGIRINEMIDKLVIKNEGEKIVTGLDLQCIKGNAQGNDTFNVSMYPIISDDKALMPGKTAEKYLSHERGDYDFLECIVSEIDY